MLFNNIDDIENVDKLKELVEKYNSLSNEDKLKVLNSLNNIIISCQLKNRNIKDSFETLKDNINNEDVEERLKKLRSRFF